MLSGIRLVWQPRLPSLIQWMVKHTVPFFSNVNFPCLNTLIIDRNCKGLLYDDSVSFLRPCSSGAHSRKLNNFFCLKDSEATSGTQRGWLPRHQCHSLSIFERMVGQGLSFWIGYGAFAVHLHIDGNNCARSSVFLFKQIGGFGA